MGALPLYLIVSQHFPVAGTWRGSFVADFAEAVRRAGRFDVRVLVPGEGEDETHGGIPVYRFGRVALRSAIAPFLFRKRNRAIFLRKLAEVGIAPAQVAVCHAHGVFMGDYALALKAENPGVLTALHHHDLASFGLMLGVLRHCWLNRRLLYPSLLALHNALDVHVFVSSLAEQSFRATPDGSWSVFKPYRDVLRGLAGLPSPEVRRAIVLPNGVDRSRFHPPEARRTGAPFTIGFVGNLIPEKDPLTLLQAVAGVRSDLPEGWQLLLMGTGAELGACVRFIRRHRLEGNVRFVPERAHAQMPGFYASLDLLVVPSIFEAFGCVYAEAGACGVPFIGCLGQGLSDWVGATSPALVPPRDPQALGARIVQFLREPWSPPAPPDIDQAVPRFLDELMAEERK